MKPSRINWQADFPIHEEVEDFTGKQRAFVLTCHEGELGFTVRASEAKRRQLGYEFAAYSETSPYSALGRVRDKIRRGLATRCIGGTHGDYHMLHNELRGRITSDKQRGVLLVVDGIPLEIHKLESFLRTHEGSEFKIAIADALE
jgi:hypothetical protein